MIVRKYIGSNEREALEKVRRDLGPDAVILESHRVTRRSFFGLRRERVVELWAGTGFEIRRPVSSPAMRAAQTYGARPPTETDRIERQVAELHEMVRDTRRRLVPATLSGLEPELVDQYLRLTSRAVSEELARDIVCRIRRDLPPEDLRNPERIQQAIVRTIAALVPCTDGITLVPNRCVKVAFFGPTGVGKTTTIAKLMAIYTYRRKRVGVITCDTYRIAASDQIRRVAELVNVPVEVCARPADAAAALERYEHFDLVLVDTAGRSQRHGERMKDLKALLDAIRPDERHLVVATNCARETIREVVQRFAPVGFDRLVLTKMDETVAAGLILDVLVEAGRHLSFLTTGQEIPKDIEVADPERLAGLIVGSEQVV